MECTTNASDVSAQKAALRKRVLKRRDALTPAVRAEKSAIVCQRIVKELTMVFAQRAAQHPAQCSADSEHPFTDSAQRSLQGLTESEPPTIGLFSCLGSEVNLGGVVRYARQVGWNLAFPVMFTSEHAPGYIMHFVQVDYESVLQRTQAFLAKPAKNISPQQFDFEQFPRVLPQNLDALAVPLVAFDTHGGRLGYGGGNYDRFLPQLRAHCYVFGVAFSEQCVSRVPQNTLDCALSCVVHA